MTACAACGTLNPETAKFCSECGAALVATAPREERKLVTILFADVTGSTALGERLDAEGLKEVMGAYFEAVREEIEAEGGTVEKFIGDAVMAAFGVPTAHEDDPARALRAALRIRRRLAAVNEELRAGHGVDLEIRIGINTGEVLAVTAPRPGEAMATGDAVNVAARLEQAAKPGQVLVSERTVAPRAASASGASGRSRFAARRRRSACTSSPAPSRATPARNRRTPRRPRARAPLLQTVYEGVVAESRPHLVTLYGEPGVGKSRFVGASSSRGPSGRSPRPRSRGAAASPTGRASPSGRSPRS